MSHPASPYDRPVVGFLGLPLDLVTMDEAMSRLRTAARQRRRQWLSTVNLDWMLMAREDPAFKAAILRSDLVTCDGAPLLKLAQLMGLPLSERVTGADLFDQMRKSQEPALSTYFFGGRGDSAARATAALEGKETGLTAAGGANPGFGDLDTLSSEKNIGQINAADPDFLIVALGAAKGQAWIDRNRDRLNTPIIAHLGAVVDFAADEIARAPKLAQSLHMEWAWRIGQDPALWRRYAKDATLLPRLINEAMNVKSALGSLAKRPKQPLSLEQGKGWISIGGQARGEALADIGDALWAAEQAGEDLTITLKDQIQVDLALPGHLLIAHQRWLDRNLRLGLHAEEPSVRTLLHMNGLPLSSRQADPFPASQSDDRTQKRSA